MNWKEQLRDASFRGKPFFVEKHRRTGGRRKAKHQFPLRDKPYNQDLGRKARTFTIEAYVLGPDYMAARDALLEALEAYGSGELVHPYFGTMTVGVDDFDLTETTKKGGLATFSVTFCEEGKNPQPTTSADTSWAVQQSAESAAAEAKRIFSGFDTSGPEWVRIEAWSRINNALDAVQGVVDSAAAPVNMASLVNSDIATLKGDAFSLLATPSSLADRLSGVVSGLFPSDLSDPVSVGKSLFTYSKPSPTASPLSTMGSRAEKNANAVADLVRRVALTETANSVAAKDFKTYDDALATRDILVDALDDEAAKASDPVYRSLTDLRVAVVKDISGRSALPRVATYKPAETLPALVVAHSIYGDADRADEICTRNRVRHPGAVPGGTPLEVLTNE